MSNAIKNPRGLPAQGGSAWHPDGWVPGDDEDIRIDRQIDHETDQAITSYEHYDDLIEHCAGNVEFSNALHNIVSAWVELKSRPMSMADHRRLHDEVEASVESLVDAFTDVTRIRVGEHVEKGQSYLYDEAGQ